MRPRDSQMGVRRPDGDVFQAAPDAHALQPAKSGAPMISALVWW
jgi:hypothetical protein